MKFMKMKKENRSSRLSTSLSIGFLTYKMIIKIEPVSEGCCEDFVNNACASYDA